ncbi:MAG: tRNA epoxyqueuosine(34) reductase QueG [Pseudomonadota bacterium]
MNSPTDLAELKEDLRRWSRQLGFQQMGVTDIDLEGAERRLGDWLGRRFHGSMTYMQRHGTKRSRPQELIPGTIRVVSVRMDYLEAPQSAAVALLDHPSKAYISRYALGRDYHKVLRKRLAQLAARMEAKIGPFGYRAFVDSAPVLEKPLAEKAGLGWIGKHTNLIDRDSGSWFFLGELYTDLPLPVDAPASGHCGSCRACIDVCPTDAIVAPYVLDARRCISYLTIESREAIPLEFRDAIGNRIYGCDDCQLFCPWNKFAKPSDEDDFRPRHGLDTAELVELFGWSREQWENRMQGSAIRRIGYTRWLANLAIALGNASSSESVIAALAKHRYSDSDILREHVNWALDKHARARSNLPEKTSITNSDN